MRECKKVRDLIALYASGDLEQEHRARVEEHLRHCPECRRAAEQMRTLAAAASAERVRPPEQLTQRILEQVRQSKAPASAPRGASRRVAAFCYGGAVLAAFAVGLVVGLYAPALKAQRDMMVAIRPPLPHPAKQEVRIATEPPAQEKGAEAEAATDDSENADSADVESASGDSGERDAPANRPRPPVRYAYRRSLPSRPIESPGAPEPPQPAAPARVQAPMPAGMDDIQLARAPQGEFEW